MLSGVRGISGQSLAFEPGFNRPSIKMYVVVRLINHSIRVPNVVVDYVCVTV